jgi:hypothetical protein
VDTRRYSASTSDWHTCTNAEYAYASFGDPLRFQGSNTKLKNAYRILVGKPEGKRPLGRPRCRWVDNIKIDVRMGWYGLDRSGLG